MLTAIRDRVSGWIAYFIVALISIPFALWGIDQYFGAGDPLVAAEVNGVAIPVNAFNYQFQQQRRYLQQLYGDELPAGQGDAAIKQNVIASMVRAEVLRQEAQAARYRVGDQAVLEELTTIEAFKTDGRFDERRYNQILQVQGQTKAGFEQNLRQQVGLSFFEDGVWRSAFLPPSAQRDLNRLQHQRRKLAYFVIPADATRAEVGGEAITAYYEAHRDSFQTAERVKLAYLELRERALKDQLKPDAAALRLHYLDNLDRYSEPEQRRVRHILIKVSEGVDQEAIEAINEARMQAEDIASRLQAGEDFAAAAKQFSQDALSVGNGGDLGLVAPGDLNPEIDEVLFGLHPGEISDPIKTSLGFQIIQLVDVQPAKQAPFKQVREKVAREYRQREAQERFVARAEQLETLSYEQSASLDPAANALDLTVQETDWVAQNQGEGIAANPKVWNAALREEVLQGGHNSDLVELESGHVVVVRVIEHEPPKTRPLEELRETIRQILAVQQARDDATKAGEKALAALRGGKKLNAVAEKYETKIQRPGFVERGRGKAPSPIVAEVFTLDKPASESATFGGVPLGEGYAVIALREVQSGDAEPASDAEPGAQEPSVSYGLREREAAFEALEANAEIVINRDNL